VADAASEAGYRVFGVDASESMLPLAEEVCYATFQKDGMPDIHPDVPIITQPEALLHATAIGRDHGLYNWHGPSTDVVTNMMVKSYSTSIWSEAGIGTKYPPVVIGPEIPDYLAIARDTFGPTFWLRANGGAGARGAILVRDLRAAFHWIRLHEVQFGEAPQFVAEEYLPGLDYCWTALYHEGERVASFARERLEWLYPHLAPFSGRTGTPTYSRVVHDSRVLRTGEQAVALVDPKPHGVYCVDMREDEDGHPVPTEINAGRWATTSPLYHMVGPNLVAAQIRLANGDHVGEIGDDCYPEGAELLRHIDMGSMIHA
jgi:carbamoyl-phosphate synthase large subunit